MKLSVLLCLAIAATGCIKGPKLKTGLGNEVSSETMEKAVDKALEGVDPFTSQLGQQVVYLINMRIEQQENVDPIAQITRTVLGLTVTGKPAPNGMLEETLTMNVSTFDQDLKTGSVDRVEESEEYKRLVFRHLAIKSVNEKLAPLEVSRSLFADLAMGTEFEPEDDDEVPIKKITYHNLQQSSGVRAPPPNVVAKPNCGGVPNCQLRYNEISYVEAKWTSDSAFTAEHWSFVISKDAPFMAYVLERCLGRLYPLDGTNYYVKQCQFVRDFSYSGAIAP